LVDHIINIAMEAELFSNNSIILLDLHKSDTIQETNRPVVKSKIQKTQENGHLAENTPSEIKQLGKYNSLIEIQIDDMEEIEEDITDENSLKKPENKEKTESPTEIILTKEPHHHHQAIEKFKEDLDRAEKLEPEDQNLSFLKAELKKQKPFKDEVEQNSPDFKKVFSKGRNNCLSFIDETCNIY